MSRKISTYWIMYNPCYGATSTQDEIARLPKWVDTNKEHPHYPRNRKGYMTIQSAKDVQYFLLHERNAIECQFPIWEEVTVLAEPFDTYIVEDSASESVYKSASVRDRFDVTCVQARMEIPND